MAYSRRPKMGARRPRRKRGARSGGGMSSLSRFTNVGARALQMSMRAMRGINYIRGLVNSEMYKLDQQYGSTDPPTNLTEVYPLTNISIGDSSSTRTGNSIFARCLFINGTVRYPPTATAATGANYSVRVSIVADSQQIGDTTPAYTDIYAIANPFAPLNPNTVGRFSILYSNVFSVVKDNNDVKIVKILKNLRHHVRYNGSSSSDIQRGGLYLTFASDASVAANSPTHYFDARTSYHDN